MNENEEKIEEVIDVEYDKAPLYKRWFAFFIDLFIMLFCAALFYGFQAWVTDYVPAYKNVIEEREQIQIASGLYDEKGVLILDVIENSDKTYTDKKNQLADILNKYYQNENFFADKDQYSNYEQRMLQYKDEAGNAIFVETEEGVKESGIGKDEVYYQFYFNEIGNFALPLLSYTDRYVDCNRVIVVTKVAEIVIAGALGFFISFMMFPLILKRGRQTVGMYLFKISLIGSDALNVSGKALVVRMLLLFFIGYLLDIVAVFIPFLVSLSMMHLSRSGQDFFDYVSYTYVIDSSKDMVYLDYSEYRSAASVKKEASIENKNYKID